MLTLVETPLFEKRIEKNLTESELSKFKGFLARNPERGDLIRGTAGLRKIRWGVKGSGKSGGVRIIYYYHDDSIPIFLITAFRKSKKESLTEVERNELKGLGKKLAAAYGK